MMESYRYYNQDWDELSGLTEYQVIQAVVSAMKHTWEVAARLDLDGTALTGQFVTDLRRYLRDIIYESNKSELTILQSILAIACRTSNWGEVGRLKLDRPFMRYQYAKKLEFWTERARIMSKNEEITQVTSQLVNLSKSIGVLEDCIHTVEIANLKAEELAEKICTALDASVRNIQWYNNT